MSEQILHSDKSDDLESVNADDWNLEINTTYVRCGVHNYPVGMIKRVYTEKLETDMGFAIGGLSFMIFGAASLANGWWGNVFLSVIFGALTLFCIKFLWNAWSRMNHCSVWIKTGSLPVKIFVGPEEQAETVKAEIERSIKDISIEDSHEIK